MLHASVLLFRITNATLSTWMWRHSRQPRKTNFWGGHEEATLNSFDDGNRMATTLSKSENILFLKDKQRTAPTAGPSALYQLDMWHISHGCVKHSIWHVRLTDTRRNESRERKEGIKHQEDRENHRREKHKDSRELGPQRKEPFKIKQETKANLKDRKNVTAEQTYDIHHSVIHITYKQFMICCWKGFGSRDWDHKLFRKLLFSR